VPESDVSLILAGAAAWCVEFRSLEEWKRGLVAARYEQRLQAVKAEYRHQWRARRRRVRMGAVSASG
jgi:hypothetical protein